MTPDEICGVVLRALGTIAPEADLAHLRPEVSFRDQMDIDSMDFLNFVIALHKELHVEIPEKDYPKLATLHGCMGYLKALCDVQSRQQGRSSTSGEMREGCIPQSP